MSSKSAPKDEKKAEDKKAEEKKADDAKKAEERPPTPLESTWGRELWRRRGCGDRQPCKGRGPSPIPHPVATDGEWGFREQLERLLCASGRRHVPARL